MGLILGDPNAEMLPAVLGRNGDLFSGVADTAYIFFITTELRMEIASIDDGVVGKSGMRMVASSEVTSDAGIT